MNRPDLHWLAEQFHSGRTPEGLDFGSANLDQEGKLQLIDQALQAFPTEASLWAGSNEVVLPDRDIPSNIQPFNRFTQVPPSPRAPRPSRQGTAGEKVADKALPLKVHWRLKIAIRRQKQRLYLDLLWRGESLENAYRDFLEGVGGWEAVERVHLEYVDMVRDANAFISAVWDDQEEYYWGRSKSWQNSDSAWSYRVWMEAWERELSAPSLPSRAGGTILKLDAATLLRGIPDEPAE
jgi:hypothetical protein